MRTHWRWATVVLIGAPLAGLALGLCLSPLLWIETVVVGGPDPSLADEVARQIGLPARASMLFYPLNRVTTDARKCYRVDTVSVRRASPHLLTVAVTPRPPFAALDDGKGCTLASREGILLYRVPEAPSGMPRLSGLTAPRAPLGSWVEPERWRWTCELLAGASKSGIRGSLWLDMTNLHRITVRTADGVTGNLGNVNSLARKAAVLGRVLQQVRWDGQRVVSVDVSTPETPLWKTR
jgi:cell division septal protein FtsQ